MPHLSASAGKGRFCSSGSTACHVSVLTDLQSEEKAETRRNGDAGQALGQGAILSC